MAMFSTDARHLALAYSGDDIQDANLEEKNTNAKILSAHVNVVEVSLFL